MDLYNDDCFNVFPKLKDKSIDLFVLDLPYGQTACKWDSCIDLTKMWVQIKRIMKPNAVILFYCTTKFGYKVIQSNEKWFRYDLIWKKSRKVGFLSANKMPLRQHENIYVFSDDNNDDLDNSRNKELRSYAEKVKKYIGKSLKQINKDMENRHAEHFFYIKSTQFGIPTEETYNKLIEIYKINEMEGFIDYKTLKSKWEKEPETTYNPHKTEGTPYKKKENKIGGIYGNVINTELNNKGNRHPTSIYPETIETTILAHNNPVKSLHRTQKPTSLCEWLIKTYSNEGDTVMDFTMGSGTTGEACKNTKRKFIGVEMDKDIFKVAKDRLNK